jgi:hypothetical protein
VPLSLLLPVEVPILNWFTEGIVTEVSVVADAAFKDPALSLNLYAITNFPDVTAVGP